MYLREFLHYRHPVVLPDRVAEHCRVGHHVEEEAFLESNLERANNGGRTKLLPKAANLVDLVTDIVLAIVYKEYLEALIELLVYHFMLHEVSGLEAAHDLGHELEILVVVLECEVREAQRLARCELAVF